MTNIKDENRINMALWTISLIVVLLGVVTYMVPPSVFPDPSWGFQVMQSMQKGGGFNLLVSPSPTDISKNVAPFLSWWSPGQYLIPYFFQSVLHINTAHAAVLAITLGNLSGLLGFYYFFKKLGFTRLIATLSLVFIFIQQAFWIPYAFYNGGEVLLFGFEGWFLYGCVSFAKPGLKFVLFVLLSGLIGFVCKSSFMWIYVSGLLVLWIRLSKGQAQIWSWIKKGFWLGIPAVLSLAIIYMEYLSKGENPASASNGFKFDWQAFGFPIASPLLSGFSVDDLVGGLIYRSGAPVFSSCITVATLLILILISILLIIAIIRFAPNNNYKLFIVVFYSVSILFFAYSFLKQAAISYEGRHFRLIGLLIVPGVIYVIGKTRFYWQGAFFLVCAYIAYHSYHFARITHKGNGFSAHGPTGIAQEFIDQPSLDHILALDNQKRNVIFVFISADLGLEIQHNRIITVDPYDAEIADDDRVAYLGYAGPVYFVLPTNYTGAKLATMIKYFPGYKNFVATPLSKNYVLYIAN